MRSELTPALLNALEGFKEQFGFALCPNGLLVEEVLHGRPSRDDLLCCYLSSVPLRDDHQQPPATDEMRRWLLANGFFLQGYTTQKGNTDYLLAPLNPLRVSTAYHATAKKNLTAIMRDGLLPGDPEKGRASTGNRFDCVGNIYVCEKLGTPDDAGRKCTYSAHWWCDELAKGGSERAFVILELVNLETIPGLTATRDFASDSGIILVGVDRIPAEHFHVVWEN